jgi:hypothetical protein
MQPAATDQTRPFWRSAVQRSWQRTGTGPAPLGPTGDSWLWEVNFTGNHRFSHEIWGFAKFPLNQSIQIWKSLVFIDQETSIFSGKNHGFL